MERNIFLKKIIKAFKVHPVVAILGPRQCGKTTLARRYAADFPTVAYFDLEDPRHLAKLENPMLALEDLEGLIIIDEIQRRPELFPILRVLVDRPNNQQKYLILGSASRDLIRQSSESLAGRIADIELTPFSLNEATQINQLWLRGGFPKSYLAETNEESEDWRKMYISTFLERDIPSFGITISPQHLRRFWMMLVHFHGNIFNAAEICRSLAITNKDVKHYLDILSSVFMIRQLHPWFENIRKRQVKSPKIYFRDSGIFHSFLNIVTMNDIKNHPKLGASWEGFALEEVIRFQEADPLNCYFWASHQGAELDLLIFQGSKRLGFEIKYTDSPKLTPSMRIAMEDLKLDQLTVIVPGKDKFALAPRVNCVGLESYTQTT